MTDKLTFKENKEKWYPYPIYSLEEHLKIFIGENDYFKKDKTNPLIKNLAYSLQYLEFINQVLENIKLSSVLKTQNIKSFLVCSSGIIEAIFYFLVVSKGHGKKTEWEIINSSKSNEFIIDSLTYKNEITLLKKLDQPKLTQMTFDQLAKKVEQKKLLGNNFPLYSKINAIRKLRNKIHIHDSEYEKDTDWNNFNESEFLLIRQILYEILTSEIFNGSNRFKIFDYLKNFNY